MNKNEWSQREIETLIKLKELNLSYKKIAEILDRSIDSCRCKYWLLREENKFDFEKKAKILFFDIETSLMTFTGFSTGRTFISSHQIEKDYHVISWAAKWKDNKKVHSDVLSKEEALADDDKRILKGIWNLLDEADIVIGHNIDRFDIKKLNTRFIKNKLGIPKRYKTIDTLKLARKTFAFSSNKLDDLCLFLGLRGKTKHDGYEMWLGCRRGDKKALQQMVKYNRNDVVILEPLYEELKAGLYNVPKRPQWGYKNENN